MARKITSLNGDTWWLGQAPEDSDPNRATWQELDTVPDWLPATVPGNVRADLVRGGRLPELATALAVEEAQWVDDHCWWLVRDFSCPSGARRRMHLSLRGIDYVGDLFLNGEYLGRHEGMFSPSILEVTELLGKQNRLAVRLLGSRWLPSDRSSNWEKIWNGIEARFGSIAKRYPQRRDTLKCQMSFGWDFAPPLRTMGIWDDACLIACQDVFIMDVSVKQEIGVSQAVLTVRIALDSLLGGPIFLRLGLEGDTFEAVPLSVKEPVRLPAGTSCHELELSVPDPVLWWPWDHGEPNLYRLTVEAWGDTQCLDSLSLPIGIRRLEFDGWTLRVNGARVYARGANWVPADILPGRVTETDYGALLDLARQANMNLLRVWGGGLREKHAFYDQCDRLGLLVWQEFPFACAFLTHYPRSGHYLQLVETEARAIVRSLRNHPSLAIWCGGNEFSPSRNKDLVATLSQVVTDEDPARPFLPVSPHNGDSHYWQVWHGFQPPSRFGRDHAAFASEFGFQAPPAVAALRRFIPDEELWPPGPAWVYHGAEVAKLERYAWPYLTKGERSLDHFVQACQRAQSYGLQIAIEHYRRRKAHGCGGALIWQLNEPWPAISWALVDARRQPKPAYETVKRLFSPLLVSVDYPLQHYQPGDRLMGQVWIINDTHRPLTGCHLALALLGEGDQKAHHAEEIVDIAPDSATIVDTIDWLLPPGRYWRLTCRLSHSNQLLACNEYDLAVHDDLGPSIRHRLRALLTSLIVRD